ncbi:MAG TPA: hypothetical protein VJ914_00560 [Pseudonocardiaceae bacterium]|nr:hypothetical protein [Pseudonocardiaceae bacterium]
MFTKTALALTTLAAAAALSGGGTAAHATQANPATNTATVGKTACAGLSTAQPVAPHTAESATPVSVAEAAAVGQYKARHNAQEAQLRQLGAGAAAGREQKLAGMRAGDYRSASSRCAGTAAQQNVAPQDTVIGGLVHWGQITNWFCGPATVSEMSGSVPGPSSGHLSQNTAASYMGTTQADGTTDAAMVNGLNYFVGQPDFNRNFYAFVWVSDTPTSAERSSFINDLHTDIGVYSPVAGNGWEVPGGPHLVGHPANEEIFHFFQIGGYNTDSSQVYYSDSANTVWSSVPDFSWFNTYTLVTILGGRGYVW